MSAAHRSASYPVWLRPAAVSTAVLAVVLAAASFAAGCGGGDGQGLTPARAEESDEKAVRPSSTVPAETIQAKPVDSAAEVDGAAELDGDDQDLGLDDGPTLTILDPGSEPRVELRLKIAPGQSETMVLTQTQTLTQVIDGQPGPDVGAITTEIISDLSANRADDLITISSIVTDAAVIDAASPTTAAQIEAEIAGVVGMETVSAVDDRGRAIGTQIAGLSGIDPALADQMEEMATSSQMAIPLPNEPIGVGAEWTVGQRIPSGGVVIEQYLTYRLVAADLPVIELAVAGTQTVVPGTAFEFGGVTGTVVWWEFEIDGTIVQDLSMIVPTGSSTVAGTQVLEVAGSRLEQTIDTTNLVGPPGGSPGG